MPLRTLPVALAFLGCLFGPMIGFSATLEKRARNEALFTNGVVRRIEIDIAAAEMEKLKRDGRTYVQANLKEGANVFTNVGLHLKGVGSFRPLDDKPSFSIKFNKFVDDQEFYGLSKIALNNSVQDLSYINEALCTELFRAIGVPAGRVTHAWVQLNGRKLGLYVLIEGINKDFLRRHFKTDKGNLYEGYTQDINEELDQDNGKELTQADLRTLAKAAQEANPAERWLRLDKLLDIERFISMMAGEMIMAHWDGYWVNRNNYRIYNDQGRMVMFPHGLDNMWQQEELSWRPTMSGLLTRAVLMTPRGHEVYSERIASVLTNHFQVARLTNRVNEIAARLRPEIKAHSPGEFEAWESEVRHLHERIVKRVANIAEQLKRSRRPLAFDAQGRARLAEWKFQVDGGDAECTQEAQDQKTFYLIKQKGSDGCIASWRARAVLEPGRYRFEGRAKTIGIMPANREEIGLAFRISGVKVPPQIGSASDWRAINHEFAVSLPRQQVELVCELSCLLGEAWLDPDSLQLVRLQ